jgi:hypothetical protein
MSAPGERSILVVVHTGRPEGLQDLVGQIGIGIGAGTPTRHGAIRSGCVSRRSRVC